MAKKAEDRTTISLRLGPRRGARVEAAAAQDEVSVAEWVRRALDRQLESYQTTYVAEPDPRQAGLFDGSAAPRLSFASEPPA